MTREEALDVLTGWLPIVKLRKYKAAMQIAIDALSAPELPSELEEAAEEYVAELGKRMEAETGKNFDEDVAYLLKGLYKMGAKWQAEQFHDGCMQ